MTTRDVIAVTLLAAAVAAAASGAYLVAGPGWALLATCPLLLVAAVLVGWV